MSIIVDDNEVLKWIESNLQFQRSSTPASTVHTWPLWFKSDYDIPTLELEDIEDLTELR